MSVVEQSRTRAEVFIGHLRRALRVSYTRLSEHYREEGGIPVQTNCFMLLNWAIRQEGCRAWQDWPTFESLFLRGSEVKGMAEAKLGDWLFVFDRKLDGKPRVSHVGALASQGQTFTVIHASSRHGKVIEEPFIIFWERYALIQIRRMLFES